MAERNVLLATNVDAVGGVSAALAKFGPMYVSEKYDGLRCLLHQEQSGSLPVALSSQGNKFAAPSWWLSELNKAFELVRVERGIENEALVFDGELWMGYGSMQSTQSVVRKKVPGKEWQDVTFLMFDVPKLGTMSHVQPVLEAIRTHIRIAGRAVTGLKNILPVEQELCSERSEVERMFDLVMERGGEGLMLRSQFLTWTPRRVRDLLKYKPNNDGEATIIGYNPGTGKYLGKLGSLQVRDNASGKEFALSGMTDLDRKEGWEANMPIGTIVSYKYTSLTDSGIPREARYWAR